MRFWFARNSEVSIREQLVTQVVLGILSGDLRPGERLPSTRELARRFNVHSNTISAAYRQLEHGRWVELRRGSGVYVRKRKPRGPLTPALALDHLIANLLHSAHEQGADLPAVRARLRRWLRLQPPDHFLVVEPDQELREIVMAEIRQVVTFPVSGCDLDGSGPASQLGEVALSGAITVALPHKEAVVRKALPGGTELLTLRLRSVPASLAEWLPARPEALVAVVSRLPEFLKLGRTMMEAAGFHPDGLVFRDARAPGWDRGLSQMAAVVTDMVTAQNSAIASLGQRARTAGAKNTLGRVIVFSLLAESSLEELRSYEAFIRRPAGSE